MSTAAGPASRLRPAIEAGPGSRDRNRQNGQAILRVARELREWLRGEEVDQSFLDDLDRMEEVGRWLASSTPIPLQAEP